MFISDKAVLRTDRVPVIKTSDYKELKAINHSDTLVVLYASNNLSTWEILLSLTPNSDGSVISTHKYYKIEANKLAELYMYFADAPKTLQNDVITLPPTPAPNTPSVDVTQLDTMRDDLLRHIQNSFMQFERSMYSKHEQGSIALRTASQLSQEMEHLHERLASIDNGLTALDAKITLLEPEVLTLMTKSDNTTKLDFFVATPNETNAIVASMDTPQGQDRRKLQLLGTFGKLHLDFTAQQQKATISSPLFILPDDAPTPTALIELQTHDGGTIWIGKDRRVVLAANLTVGTRYIVDLIGFWAV